MIGQRDGRVNYPRKKRDTEQEREDTHIHTHALHIHKTSDGQIQSKAIS